MKIDLNKAKEQISDPHNPLQGATIVALFVLSAAAFAASDSAWIIFIATVLCGLVGTLMGYNGGINKKNTVIGAITGLAIGAAWYFFCI